MVLLIFCQIPNFILQVAHYQYKVTNSWLLVANFSDLIYLLQTACPDISSSMGDMAYFWIWYVNFEITAYYCCKKNSAQKLFLYSLYMYIIEISTCCKPLVLAFHLVWEIWYMKCWISNIEPTSHPCTINIVKLKSSVHSVLHIVKAIKWLNPFKNQDNWNCV